MKVRDTEDRFGKQCICFPKSATINEIHEYLNRNFMGYQFAIVIDETQEEFEYYDEVVVNFFNDLADEAVEASGEYKAISNREWREIQAQLAELRALKAGAAQ